MTYLRQLQHLQTQVDTMGTTNNNSFYINICPQQHNNIKHLHEYERIPSERSRTTSPPTTKKELRQRAAVPYIYIYDSSE